MADTISATIVPLHQPRPKTPAERAKAYRDRKRAKAQGTAAPVPPVTVCSPGKPALKIITPSRVTPVTPSRPAASMLLMAAAFGLASVGVTMNAWFARSLGSTDYAGWLFLAVGVAADLAALAVPSCAARLWETHRRGAAATGWLVWLATFAFAVTAGIGFASVNISDVTLARASRVTPAVTQAQAALTDAMTARDRECGHGVGKFCREREQTVNEQRAALNAVNRTMEQAADPQTEAARKIVAWLTFGLLRPSGDDFAMLRLVLLALLPQIGGVLLMLARTR
jgi:hypothetical protein